MKKKQLLALCTTVCTVFAFGAAGCGSSTADSSAASTTAESEISDSSETSESVLETESVSTGSEAEVTDEAEITEAEKVVTASDAQEEASAYELRVGSLKGPTTMGLVNLMNSAEAGESTGLYSFDIQAQPDVIAASVISGDLDIALLPANMASILYNKTEGGISVIGINTLGVLDVVTGDDSITTIADLSGRTLYSTGQGATPEYAINYLLAKYGVTDCTVEFKSEATEVAASLAADPSGVAVLPQPFATAAQIQNEALHKAFSLTDAWNEVTEDGSQLITGVTIVRNEVLAEHKDAVDLFLQESAVSVETANADAAATAELVVKYGIVEKAPIAQRAIPECNIVSITGAEMQTALSGYLHVLAEADAQSVGGIEPAEDFYYLG